MDLDAEFGASPLGKSKSKLERHADRDASTHDNQESAAVDLYGDLIEDNDNDERNFILKTKLTMLQEQCIAQENIINSLEAQVQSLTTQNSELRQEKDTLLHNISTLFNTAKLELERKNSEIKELRAITQKPNKDGVGGGRRRDRTHNSQQ